MKGMKREDFAGLEEEEQVVAVERECAKAEGALLEACGEMVRAADASRLASSFVLAKSAFASLMAMREFVPNMKRRALATFNARLEVFAGIRDRMMALVELLNEK
jgi:hypothetical protein